MEQIAAFIPQQHQALSIYPACLSVHSSIHLFIFLVTFVFIVNENSVPFSLSMKFFKHLILNGNVTKKKKQFFKNFL